MLFTNSLDLVEKELAEKLIRLETKDLKSAETAQTSSLELCSVMNILIAEAHLKGILTGVFLDSHSLLFLS